MRALLRVLLCFLLLGSSAAFAATDSYQYDPLGRLVQWTDSQGRVTEYRYDAVGNILEVKRVTVAAPGPAVSMVSPNNLRRGETKMVTLTGTNLSGTTIASPSPELSLSGVQLTATQITFMLSASAAAPLGIANFVVTSTAGTAMFGITVNPSTPTIIISPAPLAVPIDNIDRTFFIRLSNTDTIDHVLSLSTANSAISTVTPAMLTIPAGQTEITAKVRGVSDGTTSLTITSPGIVPSSVGIYVTAEFGGINVATAPLLGILLQSSGGTGTSFVTDFVSPVLGVAFGRYITGVTPANFVVGTGPASFTVNGAGLEGVTGIAVSPPDGVTISGVTAATNGSNVTANITVAANAPTTTRQITLTGGAGPYVPTHPQADRINITFPMPEVHSIEPFFAEPGASVQLIVRGKNLSSATGVSLNPATGVNVGASPVITPDGTQLTVGVSFALNAPTGDRIVTVQSAIGSSDATPTPANTFHVVSQIQTKFAPITAPLLGVVLNSTSGGSASAFEITSPSLGVSLGAVATNLSPAAAQFDTSFSLTIAGAGLQGVTTVDFTPPDGITVGAISPAPDGSSVVIAVTLAANAAQTIRQVQVRAGSQAIAFAPIANNLFRVTGPAPRVDSVSPQLIAAGATVPVTINGINLQNASEIRVTPSTGVAVGSIVVSTDGAAINIPFAVASNAAFGPRTIVVVTPAGETSAIATVGNTFTIYSGNATTVDPIVSPLLGVLYGAATGPTNTTVEPIVAPLLGVVVTPSPPAPTSVDFQITSPALSVALGAAATTVKPTPFNQGTTTSITINGVGLNGVTAVSLLPATGLVLGSPVANGDGLSVTIPITIGATAPIGVRAVLLSAGSTSVSFAKAENATLTITAAGPRIDSIEPILGDRNSTVSLIIRGANLQFTNAISISPADGVSFEPNSIIDPAGTQLTLRMRLEPSAAAGVRRLQVTTPGGSSSLVSTPANTFTIN